MTSRMGSGLPTLTFGRSVCRYLLCMPLLAGSVAPYVRAQSLDYGALEALFGEPVTTSVTGSPQRSSEVPATMEIITAEDIRRSGVVDIPALLRHVTGVNVLRWTNSGADVGIRGYNSVFSSRLLVLVNGRQVYADHYGYTPWSSLPVELGEIRQIEVVKGPNSALFGFNAVGGVINIITFTPTHDPVNYVEVRGGTQDMVAASAAGTFSVMEGWDMRISAGARKNDDFSTPLRPVNEGSRRGDERTSLRLDTHFVPRPNVEVEFEASWTEVEQSIMIPVYVMAFEELSVKSLLGRLNADTRYGLIQASAYRNWIDDKAYTGFLINPGSDPNAPMVDFNNQVTVAQVQDIFKIGGAHTLRLSGEYRKGDLNTSPFRGGTVFYDGCALGVMWQWRLAETLTLTNAIRRDDLELGRKGLVPAGYGLGNSDWDRSLAKTSFNAGLVWATSDQDTVRLSASRGAQLPSLYNLGGFLINYPLPPSAPLPAIFFSGVPGLQPATVNNYELAWDRKLTVIEADLRMAVFHGTSRGVLADNGADLQEAAIFSTPANIGNSETDGLELSLQGTIADTWRWRAGYLYQDVDDSFTALFPAESTLTDFATTTPRHNLNASLGWTKGAWEVDGYLKYQSSTLGLQGPDAIVFPPAGALGSLVQVPGYTSVDARIAYSMDDKLVFSLSGQNLLDSEQRQTSGPDVERRVLATATYSF